MRPTHKSILETVAEQSNEISRDHSSLTPKQPFRLEEIELETSQNERNSSSSDEARFFYKKRKEIVKVLPESLTRKKDSNEQFLQTQQPYSQTQQAQQKQNQHPQQQSNKTTHQSKDRKKITIIQDKLKFFSPKQNSISANSNSSIKTLLYQKKSFDMNQNKSQNKSYNKDLQISQQLDQQQLQASFRENDNTIINNSYNNNITNTNSQSNKFPKNLANLVQSQKKSIKEKNKNEDSQSQNAQKVQKVQNASKNQNTNQSNFFQMRSKRDHHQKDQHENTQELLSFSNNFQLPTFPQSPNSALRQSSPKSISMIGDNSQIAQQQHISQNTHAPPIQQSFYFGYPRNNSVSAGKPQIQGFDSNTEQSFNDISKISASFHHDNSGSTQNQQQNQNYSPRNFQQVDVNSFTFNNNQEQDLAGVLLSNNNNLNNVNGNNNQTDQELSLLKKGYSNLQGELKEMKDKFDLLIEIQQKQMIQNQNQSQNQQRQSSPSPSHQPSQSRGPSRKKQRYPSGVFSARSPVQNGNYNNNNNISQFQAHEIPQQNQNQNQNQQQLSQQFKKSDLNFDKKRQSLQIPENSNSFVHNSARQGSPSQRQSYLYQKSSLLHKQNQQQQNSYNSQNQSLQQNQQKSPKHPYIRQGFSPNTLKRIKSPSNSSKPVTQLPQNQKSFQNQSGLSNSKENTINQSSTQQDQSSHNHSRSLIQNPSSSSSQGNNLSQLSHNKHQLMSCLPSQVHTKNNSKLTDHDLDYAIAFQQNQNLNQSSHSKSAEEVHQMHQRLKQHDKFHLQLQRMIKEMSPPGLYYKHADETPDLKNQWKFIKDLVQDYVSTKSKYKKLKACFNNLNNLE